MKIGNLLVIVLAYGLALLPQCVLAFHVDAGDHEASFVKNSRKAWAETVEMVKAARQAAGPKQHRSLRLSYGSYGIYATTPTTTKAPTLTPSREPTRSPTKQPVYGGSSSSLQSPAPTKSDTQAPTRAPTVQPNFSTMQSLYGSSISSVPRPFPPRLDTQAPTRAPTREPSKSPTKQPVYGGSSSSLRSPAPTKSDTQAPTRAPTMQPSRSPTMQPLYGGSISSVPRPSPTKSDTQAPTRAPTKESSKSPTKQPVYGGSSSWLQSPAPTKSDTQVPTRTPTREPSKSPTKQPTTQPTRLPTREPIQNPVSGGISTRPPIRQPVYGGIRQQDFSGTSSPIRATRGPIATAPACVPSPATRSPTLSETRSPTRQPTRQPVWSGTGSPTARPIQGQITNAPAASTCAPANYPSGVCKVSGDPKKQASCTPRFYSTCAAGTWSASMVESTTKYDSLKDETTVSYEVKQVGRYPTVSHISVSWGGNCCVKEASYYGSAIAFGMDPTTCKYGVKFDDGFRNGMTSAVHNVVFKGRPVLVDGAGSVTVKGGTGFCTIPVKGPNCDLCTTESSSPSGAPTALTLTAPPAAETMFPSAAPSLSPSTSPSKEASATPSLSPSTLPSKEASATPSRSPSSAPSSSPSASGTISGMVYEDLQAFGTFSPGDIGIQGVKIELLLNGTVVAETITKNDGSYSFTGLAGGLYTVQEESPLAGFFDVTDTDGDTNGKSTISVALPPGGSSGENNFLEVRVSTVSGMVTEDTNNDDKGEDPIAGVPVTLCKKDIPTDCVTTTTDNTGGFSFGGIVPGTYCVVETNIGNYIDVGDSIGSNGDELEGGSVDDPNKVCFAVVAGIDTTDIVFVDELPSAEPSGAPSSAPTTSGTISGSVLLDDDEDGNFSSGDSPIAGVKITLMKGGTTVRTTATDSTGAYFFSGLTGGDYTVLEDSVLDTTDIKDADGNANGPNTIAVALPAGGLSEKNDFLEAPPVALLKIGGFVGYHTAMITDGSFVGPLPNVLITLKKDGAVLKTTLTDANGNFLFSDVPPGDGYSVLEQNPTTPVRYFDLYDSDMGGTANLSNIGPFMLTEDTLTLKFVDWKPGAARRLSEPKNLRSQE